MLDESIDSPKNSNDDDDHPNQFTGNKALLNSETEIFRRQQTSAERQHIELQLDIDDLKN
jgi:hypothetical protein